jgi:hypothetical protein
LNGVPRISKELQAIRELVYFRSQSVAKELALLRSKVWQTIGHFMLEVAPDMFSKENFVLELCDSFKAGIAGTVHLYSDKFRVVESSINLLVLTINASRNGHFISCEIVSAMNIIDFLFAAPENVKSGLHDLA